MDSFLVVYTISGEGKLHYEGQQYRLKATQAFWIDCKTHHFYECISNHGWEILWVHFNGNSAKNYYNEFVKCGLKIVSFDESMLMESLIWQLVNLTSRRDFYSEILCSNLIVNILTKFLTNEQKEGLSFTNMPQYLEKLVHYLDLHFKEELNLDQLAHIHSISKFYMCKKFKKCIGKTILEYITDLRLNYAKELLRYSELPIETVSSTCGIRNTSYFINMFKKKERMTPLIYRQKWKL